MTDQQLTNTPTIDTAAAAAVLDRDTVIADAVSIIDTALAQMMQRDLVSSGEVADLLLDVRTLITSTI